MVWLGTADWVQVKHRWGTEVDTEGYDKYLARAVQWLQWIYIWCNQDMHCTFLHHTHGALEGQVSWERTECCHTIHKTGNVHHSWRPAVLRSCCFASGAGFSELHQYRHRPQNTLCETDEQDTQLVRHNSPTLGAQDRGIKMWAITAGSDPVTQRCGIGQQATLSLAHLRCVSCY